MDKVPYASLIESLMYIQTCTRSNISFAIEMLRMYQNKSRIWWVESCKEKCWDTCKQRKIICILIEDLKILGLLDI